MLATPRPSAPGQSSRPGRSGRRRGPPGPWAAALLAAWGALVLPAAPAGAQGSLVAARVPGAGPITDPAAALWKAARPVTVALQPQVMAKPNHLEPAVRTVAVRAVHNGGWLAFLLEWKDPTRSDRIVLDNFGDQVAVQLPVKTTGPPPAPMMGNPGGRVNIMQWRAAFQHDLDHGPPTVRDLYPNAWADVYPDEVLSATDARPYAGALGVENPISRGRATPVLDQMAEGWGSMTVKPDQHALGQGAWKDGGWRVVITRPLASGDVNAPQLRPGDRTVAAFAVWEGEHREVGARKAWAPWIPLVLAR
jgi:DMSO reductase family type II enzyme heme b subunit